MKSNKVLLGLFVGALAMLWAPLSAQQALGDDFHEIGPVNIGGPVSSIVVDQSDASQSTVYAGAYTGGVFVRHSIDQLNWERVPYMQNGQEVNLPVSSMMQLPDNTIILGTGDGSFQPFSHQGFMAMMGKGLFTLNPATNEIAAIPGTEPAAAYAAFHAYYALDYCYADEADFGDPYLIVYAATYQGLWRFLVPIENGTIEWENAAPESVPGASNGTVSQLVLARDRNVGYFTIGGKLYKINNINSSMLDVVELSANNPDIFDSTVSAVTIALAPSDNNYLYAMLATNTNSVKSIYLTQNDADWTRLCSQSVQPLGMVRGWTSAITDRGAICVNDTNPKQIYVGGNTIYSGRGYVEGSYYQWMPSSMNESSVVFSGSYMQNVFSSAMFVHSGIHQIVPSKTTIGGVEVPVYYIATNGGVFVTYNSFATFANLNRGLNCSQINGIAVSPDGSIISGATNSANPFIQARLAHFGGAVNTSWYDDGSLGNTNHDANMIWAGDGGLVAASSFQQMQPQNKRTIFVSAITGVQDYNFARSFADYLDFTQTQTWNIGQAFTSHVIAGSDDLGRIFLWENDTDRYMIDTVKVHLDLKGVLRPNGVDTLGFYTYNGEQVAIRNFTDTLPAGAKVQFLSKANNDYPFEYTVPEYASHLVSNYAPDSIPRTAFFAGDTFYVKNPIQSRAMIIGRSTEGTYDVFYTDSPNDFSRVYDATSYTTRHDFEKNMFWYSVFTIDPNMYNDYVWPTAAVLSNDGRKLYVAVSDYQNRMGMLIRVKGFENINFNASPDSLNIWLNNRIGNYYNRLSNDTLKYIGTDENGDTVSTVWFPRCISSISVDPTAGSDRLVITFEGNNDEFSNVMLVDNASDTTWAYTELVNDNSKQAAFSAIIEKNTGNIIVGTTDGVIYRDSNNQWQKYPHMQGVPVTSVVQQVREYPVRRHNGYSGINQVEYLYAKTKWPGAIYFGTYGRGIFLDMSLVSDRENEVLDPQDLSIPTVAGNGLGSLNVYPNPAVSNVSIELNAIAEGKGRMVVYDLNGRMVSSTELGEVEEGINTFSFDCSNLPQGMYLVNIHVAGHTAATKLIVR